jgi:hypothetical protein
MGKRKKTNNKSTEAKEEVVLTPTEQSTEPQPAEEAVTTKPAKGSKAAPVWYKNHKVLTAAAIALGAVLLVLVASVAMQNNSSDNQMVAVEKGKKKNKKNEPTVLARHIDGTMVAAADANIVPGCVMIENAAFDGVRPQSGLSAASVVYEIIVEGGITRFMAVYAGESADAIGPVRSARDTYLEFASEYNCGYAHAGGSYTAMLAIPRFNMRNIDALYESKYFWRDNNKYSPHNLFTNSENLYAAISDGHSWTDEPVYAVWNFVDDASLPAGETANEVSIEFGGSYNVQYTYNADAKYYERSNGGVLQTDANTGNTLTARNVVIESVPEGIYIEGKGRVNFDVTGEGDVYIFRNGVLTKGKWKKADRLDRTRYYDEAGNEIPMARGNTWVEIVPTGYTFNWQ